MLGRGGAPFDLRVVVVALAVLMLGGVLVTIAKALGSIVAAGLVGALP